MTRIRNIYFDSFQLADFEAYSLETEPGVQHIW